METLSGARSTVKGTEVMSNQAFIRLGISRGISSGDFYFFFNIPYAIPPSAKAPTTISTMAQMGKSLLAGLEGVGDGPPGVSDALHLGSIIPNF